MNHVIKPRGKLFVTYVEIYDPENPKKKMILNQHELMKDAMMDVFKKKFPKVYDTLLMHKPFISLFGQGGLSPAVQKVLDGTLVLEPCIHPNIMEFVDHMKMADKVKDAPPMETPTIFQSF